MIELLMWIGMFLFIIAIISAITTGIYVLFQEINRALNSRKHEKKEVVSKKPVLETDNTDT
jgi:uncharacterized iron-regulated membrane protein